METGQTDQNGPTRSEDARQQTGSPDEGVTLLRELLKSYDREVAASLGAALDATTGLDRVRILHSTRRVIAVHDAVLRSALCPLLDELPGGVEVADRLRNGCDRRAHLLRRFDEETRNVAAHNVYPVSGAVIEEILEGLDRSLSEHVSDETHQVAGLIEATRGSLDPDVVAARMALAAERAPTRAHRATAARPGSTFLARYYRFQDRWADWRDTHNGWLDPRAATVSPQERHATLLMDRASAGTPTIRDVLAGYDTSIGELVDEWGAATTPAERFAALQRLSAAIVIHDSVLGGVLCPLLDALPAAAETATRLRDGCHHRADLQRQLAAQVDRLTTNRASETDLAALTPLAEALIDSFHAHEKVETEDVVALLETLPGDAYRTKGSPVADAMWPWHSEGPELLALRMAMWARSASSSPHPLLERHPTSRVLRFWYHVSDHWRHFSASTPLERWVAPRLPDAPFASLRRDGVSPPAGQSGDNHIDATGGTASGTTDP